jgi:hypothetical protein
MEQITFSDLVHFTDRQQAATDVSDTKKYTLYGGAMGGGKSYWLRWRPIRRLLQLAERTGQKGIRAGLFSETYKALHQRHIVKVREEFPAWLGSFSKTDNEFILHPRYGRGVLAFLNLDDPEKYKSAEFADISVDELTQNRIETFTILRTRLRWKGVPDPKFAAGTNPDGIGHGWVKKYWIDRDFPVEEKEGDEFAFVPALPADNPYLDAGYYATLDSMPEVLRAAYKQGRWDVFEGQVFQKEWDPSIHVVRPDQYPVLPHYRKFICFDNGYVNPGAMYWCAVDYDGTIIVYRELYGPGRLYSDWGKSARELSGWNDPDPTKREAISYLVLGADSFAPNTQTRKTGVEDMKTHFRVAYEQGVDDRVLGLSQFRERLRMREVTAPDGTVVRKPGMVVYSSCVNFIRTVPILIYDKRHVEDVDTTLEDHSYDSVRMGLMSLRLPNKSDKPLSEVEKKLLEWKRQGTLSPGSLNDFYRGGR